MSKKSTSDCTQHIASHIRQTVFRAPGTPTHARQFEIGRRLNTVERDNLVVLEEQFPARVAVVDRQKGATGRKGLAKSICGRGGGLRAHLREAGNATPPTREMLFLSRCSSLRERQEVCQRQGEAGKKTQDGARHTTTHPTQTAVSKGSEARGATHSISELNVTPAIDGIRL